MIGTSSLFWECLIVAIIWTGVVFFCGFSMIHMQLTLPSFCFFLLMTLVAIFSAFLNY